VQGTFSVRELEPEREYERVRNAIQLGLERLGWTNWSRLHDFMTGGDEDDGP
jgi:hypothetical protein